MHIFEIKGVSGLIAFLAAVAGLLALAIGIPALFMMVVWNALVFEAFHGPQIGWAQGVLLWLAALILLKLALKPHVSFEFSKMAQESSEVKKRLDP
ncbi:MAG: hypothetical protein IPK79_09030 [Vampirovibrionales bacterium]|nr:hypothetical protein [Vampirovibrionales bacterium]